MNLLTAICLLFYAFIFFPFLWLYLKEVHFIHKVKKCKHLCHLCEYANVCLDGGCAYDNEDSNKEEQEFLFIKRNKNL